MCCRSGPPSAACFGLRRRAGRRACGPQAGWSRQAVVVLAAFLILTNQARGGLASSEYLADERFPGWRGVVPKPGHQYESIQGIAPISRDYKVYHGLEYPDEVSKDTFAAH
eukprot:scaffold203240_cov46-Prasinocladus_malaysianus.AAC.1